MLPPDYTKAVLASYRRKRGNKTLPLGMLQLTRRGLRAACHEVCRDRYNRTDEPILKAFFGVGYDHTACMQAIAGYDVDKFRPLVNFLKEETTNPDDKVVELVAWLVEFQPRPYDPKIDYGKLQAGASDTPQGPQGDIINEPPSATKLDVGKIRKDKRVIWAIAITVLLALTIYMTIYGSGFNRKAPVVYIGHQGCMYWNEDHYEAISCRQHGDTLVVALDSNKLIHFRKITRPDTITANAIGTIWYARYRKDYDFFTGDGLHPLDPNLRLRPITEYIIRNHIHPRP